MDKMDTTAIWKKYHQHLRRFIFSKVRDEQVTDDLLQEVFIRIHTKSHQLIDSKKLKPWTLTIARNIVMDSFKNENLSESLTESTEIINPEISDSHTALDCLPGIINDLPGKYKKALYMADIKGIKQTEIAKKLNLALPTIKSQIQRGRKLIVQGFIDCCDYKLNSRGKLVGENKERLNCKRC